MHQQSSLPNPLSLLTQLTAELHAVDDQTVEQTSARALRVVAGTLGEPITASVTRRRGTSAGVTIGHSHDDALRVDAVQYQTNSGPCLDAADFAAMSVVDDLASEDRWPEFRSGVTDLPVHAVLSLPLAPVGVPQTSLNFYSAEPGLFRGSLLETAHLAAAGVALVLTAAEHRAHSQHLARALSSNRRIGAAVGILMAQLRTNEERAFEVLRTASHHKNKKLRAVAEDVLRSHANRGRAPAGRPG